MDNGFNTDLTHDGQTIQGPWREPKQMLAEQEYGGHLSIHDDETAEQLGFKAGPIEGPTHFSQFDPLLASIWGDAWFSHGCISAHYQNMCVEGDKVQAFAEPLADNDRSVKIWAIKEDGLPVLTGTATLGPEHPETELDARRARLRAPERLIILADLHEGMQGASTETVQMGYTQNMGALYPFSLEQKVSKITEPCDYYSPDSASGSPWGRAVIPFEMISVLAEYSSRNAQWPVKGPAIGLFADLEIRMINGPLFVDESYQLNREIVKLSESRRTESYWVKSTISDNDGAVKCEVVLNHATLKDSYADYPKDA
ncbi:MAG: hypothetical protein AB8B93_10835 [Pseudomonadales bacterium]